MAKAQLESGKIRRLNVDESAAQIFLTRLKQGVVVFEPDGNIPPDFSVNGQIGVEVRRLNQHFFGGQKPEGLESATIALPRALTRILPQFDSRYRGQSFWLALRYARPVGNYRALMQKVRRCLEDFLASSEPKKKIETLRVSDRLQLDVLPGKPRPGNVFRLGVLVDENGGGFVVQLYVDNILHAIAEKDRKTLLHRHRYPTWWLVLVDRLDMFRSLESHERADIPARVTNKLGFGRVIVIDHAGNEVLLDI